VKSLVNLLSYSIVLLFIATILTGCSVGIRPAYYDLPPLDSDQYYYGESTYSQYYNVSPPPPNYNYSTGSVGGYDPWTMGTYYDYSPPQRTGYSSGASSSSSANTTWDSDNRPSMKDRGTAASNDPKAPANEQPNLRRERTAQRNSSSSDSSTSPIISHKTKRDTTQDSSKSDQSQSDQTNVKRRSPSTQDNSGSGKTDTNEKKDDEKEKQKRSAVN
jgi:hypothetical protein